MLPNRDRGLPHGPRVGHCVLRVIGSNSAKIHYHISRGFVKISKGQCTPKGVPWPSAPLFFLMLSDPNPANPMSVFSPGWVPARITPQLRVASHSLHGLAAFALAQSLPMQPLCSSTLSTRELYEIRCLSSWKGHRGFVDRYKTTAGIRVI